MQTFSTGLIVAIVGFFSSFPIVLAGLHNMGATEALASSGLMAAALSMGIAGIVLSLTTRLPASVAWSTPGAAFLITATPPESGFASAVGAFILAGALTILAGLWKPLARAAASIPVPIAQAMLAGVLLHICTGPFLALGTDPVTALILLGTWLMVRVWQRLFAVPATVLVAAGLTLWHSGGSVALGGPLVPVPTLTLPHLVLADLLSLGVPLFIVTMATQDVPGIAVLKSFGYAPQPRPLFASVGLFSILSAPFGSPATCIAALTAGLCSGHDAHPDPARRYMAAVWAGMFYCGMGLFAGFITQFASAAPAQTMPVLAGIALFSVFVQSAHKAFAEEDLREAAALTFLITASGVTLLGLGSAVWGLAAGLVFSSLHKRRAS